MTRFKNCGSVVLRVASSARNRATSRLGKNIKPIFLGIYTMTHATLTQVGLLIDKDDIDNKRFRKLTNKLTISVKTFSGYIQHTKAYSVSGKYLIIPRFAAGIKYCPKLNVNVQLSRGRPAHIPRFIAELKSNQEAVMDHIMNTYFTDAMRRMGQAGCIVNMPPGEGKTFLAMGIICALRRKTAIIVPNTYLLQQWLDLCQRYLPDTSIGV